MQKKFLMEVEQSVRLATSSLRELIDVVTGLDRELLFWYKYKPLRIVMKPLKLIGKDRDADTLVRRNVDTIAGMLSPLAQPSTGVRTFATRRLRKCGCFTCGQTISSIRASRVSVGRLKS